MYYNKYLTVIGFSFITWYLSLFAFRYSSWHSPLDAFESLRSNNAARLGSVSPRWTHQLRQAVRSSRLTEEEIAHLFDITVSDLNALMYGRAVPDKSIKDVIDDWVRGLTYKRRIVYRLE